MLHHTSTRLFFGLSALMILGGCWLGGDEPYEPLAVELAPANAPPTLVLNIADTRLEAWRGARLAVALEVTSEAAYVDAFLSVDGIEIDSRRLYPEPADDSGHITIATVFDIDTLALSTAAHEVTVWVSDPAGQQASTSQQVVLGEGLIATSAVVPATDDGWFGGGIEPELHLFDADTNTWLGCTSGAPHEGAPRLFIDADGPLVRDHIVTRNITVLIIENDGASCPTPTSIGNVSAGDDDDLLASGEPVPGVGVDDGVSSGTVALAWGRGH